MTTQRPYPPFHLSQQAFSGGSFVEAPELASWARLTFINEGSTIENPDHQHLQQAHLGFVWTNEPNERKGRTILGTCQPLPPSGDKWTARARIQQIEEWFGDMPDFLITIYAPAAASMDDASFMALVEHELYHAAQKQDQYGAPMFSQQTGKPVWTTRGHDVEQFVGVVARYGAKASMVEDMVEAANAGPTVAQARIAIACGTCLRLVS